MTSQRPDEPLDVTTQVEVTRKAEWHAPTFEEVDYSETEAGGAGAVYDFAVYAGSS